MKLRSPYVVFIANLFVLISVSSLASAEYCNSYRVTTLIAPYFNASCTDMQTNESCFDKYQAAIPLDLYYLNYSNCEWNGTQCNTNMSAGCDIFFGTTTTTTTTLCNMKITSAEPGIDLCLGDFCNVTQCVAGDQDYFGVWRYSGLKIDREYTPEQATWMAAFMVIGMALLMFAGVMISTVMFLLTKILKNSQ